MLNQVILTNELSELQSPSNTLYFVMYFPENSNENLFLKNIAISNITLIFFPITAMLCSADKKCVFAAESRWKSIRMDVLISKAIQGTNFIRSFMAYFMVLENGLDIHTF